MFETLKHYTVDPIMEAAGRFAEDPRDGKINLTVGVYQDASGNTPIFSAVKAAEARLQQTQTTKTYRALTGDPEFCDALAREFFGAQGFDSDRMAAAQTAGGAVALKVIADLLADMDHKPTVWVQTPSYGNHIPILDAAKVKWGALPYYDPVERRLQFDELLAAIGGLTAGDVFLLQGPCHNPSGADMSPEQWDDLLSALQAQGVIPWVDLAYVGFGQGLAADCACVRMLEERFAEYMICISLSKSFGLYRDRAGALYIKSDKVLRSKVMRALTSFVRPASSHAPDHGAAVSKTILGDPDLRKEWANELESMRQRVIDLRHQICDAEVEQLGTSTLSYLRHQVGMFSLLPLNNDQIDLLVADHRIYVVPGGRINVARVNPADLPRIVTSIAAV